MKIFSVAGNDQSGKTTTIIAIIKELKKRGYRVGTIKDIDDNHFTMDKKGTDTYVQQQNGSEIVSARAKNETNIMLPYKIDISRLTNFYDTDYVIVEGCRNFDVQKIMTATEESELDDNLNVSVFAISGKISNSLKKYGNIPVINALERIESLVDLIEEKVLSNTVERHQDKITRCSIVDATPKYIHKRFYLGTECDREYNNFQMLASYNVPKVYRYGKDYLDLEYIGTNTLTDVLINGEKENYFAESIKYVGEMFQLFIEINQKYGMVWHDVNPKNFIIHEGKLFAVDLEGLGSGYVEEAIGKFLAQVLTIEPVFTQYKYDLTNRLLKLLSNEFNLSPIFSYLIEMLYQLRDRRSANWQVPSLNILFAKTLSPLS